MPVVANTDIGAIGRERYETVTAEPLPGHLTLSPEQRRILLVEDDEAHSSIIQRSFERHGSSFSLTVATNLSEGIRAIEHRVFDLVITDWRLPDGEGFELLKHTRRCPLLLMTSQGNEQIAVEAIRAGALDYIVKSED